MKNKLFNFHVASTQGEFPIYHCLMVAWLYTNSILKSYSDYVKEANKNGISFVSPETYDEWKNKPAE